MNFGVLTEFFESVKSAKGNDKIETIKKYLKNFKNDANFYGLMRLILPKLDRDRAAYRLKESKITRLIIRMLDLPQGNSDREMLLKSYMSGGDLGDMVCTVMKKYITHRPTVLTIDFLNTFLDDLANRSTDQDLDDNLLDLLKQVSPNDVKWIIRIILKDLKLGIDGNRILNCYHPDGADLYATNNNLKKVCDTLQNSGVKLHEIEINVFEPFRPMLSKRIDSSNFTKSFPEERMFIVENKYDGERFQLHYAQGEFRYFSRNGFDFTNYYGRDYSSGEFTPKLPGIFADEIVKFILDGEMMIWNTRTKSFGSKGMKLDVKKLKGTKYQPCFCVYDILLKNDRILTNLPLIERLEILREIVENPVDGILVVSEYEEVNCRQDIVDALNRSIEKHEEGIVIKDPESVYKYSDRNSGWFKLKLEYFDDVIHDLDLVMLGGSYGTPNRCNSFFVGVYSKPTYLSFGKISSGLNDEQLDYLNDKLQAEGQASCPDNVIFGNDLPQIYIEPQKSCILLVRASELIRASDGRVKTPYTLRFPRVLGIRTDKPVDECLSINELLELCACNKAVIKLSKRQIGIEEVSKAKRAKKQAKLSIAGPGCSSESVPDLFDGIKFHVYSDNETMTKDEAYRKIKQSNGLIAFTLDEDTDIMLLGKYEDKLLNIIRRPHRYDVVRIEWLGRVLGARKLIEYRQEEVLSFGQNYKRRFGVNYDVYGDHYTTPATVESLKRCIDIMRLNGYYANANWTNPRNDFTDRIAYFDKFKEIGDCDSEVIYYSICDEAEFRYRGGTICNLPNSRIDFIVTENMTERKETILQYLKTNQLGDIRIVQKEFLYEDTTIHSE